MYTNVCVCVHMGMWPNQFNMCVSFLVTLSWFIHMYLLLVCAPLSLSPCMCLCRCQPRCKLRWWPQSSTLRDLTSISCWSARRHVTVYGLTHTTHTHTTHTPHTTHTHTTHTHTTHTHTHTHTHTYRHKHSHERGLQPRVYCRNCDTNCFHSDILYIICDWQLYNCMH